MDEVFFALTFGCIGLFVLLTGPVALWLVLRERRRTQVLERELSALRHELRRAAAEALPPAQAVAREAQAPVAEEPPADEPERRPVPFIPGIAPLPPSAPAPEPERVTPRQVAPLPSRPSPIAVWSARLREVDWERWIGVRGAALAGGVLLALAAILFFRHAFTQGWITPPWRCVLGGLTGVAALLLGARLRGRGYAAAPGALQGAGVVALYATAWAAQKRYELVSLWVSFPLMALVTVLACSLAVRHRSRTIAVLGLVGGFATPLLLSSGEDRPLSLFGYVLLLDLGLLFVGRRRSWGWFGFLALLATFLLQGLWVIDRMDAERVPLGIGIVAVFGALFALFGVRTSDGERRKWLPAQAGGVIFPFVFAMYFADRLALGQHAWPLALLLGLLAAAGAFLGRAQRAPWLAHGAATAGVAVIAIWFLESPITASTVWELSAIAFGLALVPHVFAEWERWKEEPPVIAAAAASASAAWALLTIIACARSELVPLHAPLAGLLGVAALHVRQAWLLRRGWLVPLAAAAVGVGIGLHSLGARTELDLHPALVFGIPAVLAVGLMALGRMTSAGLGRWAFHGAGALLVPVLFALPFREVAGALEPWFPPAAGLLLAAGVALAALHLRSGVWLGAGAALAVFVDLVWSLRAVYETPERAQLPGLAVLLATAAFFVALPAIVGRQLRGGAGVLAAPAIALALWAIPVEILCSERFSASADGLPSLLVALVGAAGIVLVRRAWGAETDAARGALAWIGAATALLVSVAIADRVDSEELALALALWTLGLAAVARLAPHAVPAWVAVASATAATLHLVASAVEPGHYARADAVLWNRLSLVHLPAAAALIGAAVLVRPVDPGSRAPRRLRALPIAAPGLGAIVVVFAWLNLEILNRFGTEDRLRFDVGRLPARDLTTSIAWGVYALVLLGLGTWRRVMALRWASLALFFLAIGKVFLHDLDHLQGLYRVASLAGLAISLMVVSLFYQRFVFRSTLKAGGAEAASPPDAPES